MPNIGVFYRHKNSIDIFVEDNNDDEFYKTLLQRIYDESGYKIGKLIPLGGKREVTSACRSDQNKRNQKRIYIVDADLELITDDNEKGLKHYFVLPRYCIENHLFDKEAIVEILHDNTILEKKIIENHMSYDNWLMGLSKPLVELFINYSISKKINPTYPTVSYAVGKLCKVVNKVNVLDEVKVNNRIEEVKLEILKTISEEQYNEITYALRQKWLPNVDSLLRIVSGKDYLFPLLEFRIQKFKKLASFNLKRDTLRIRLAKLSEIPELLEIRRT